MSDYSNSEIPNGLYYADVAVLAKIFAKRYGTSVDAAYEWLTKDVKVPSADVQPVVRCKNCKHYKTTGNFKTYCDEENFPDEGQKELPEWWFCAGGKRKGSDG